MKKKRENERGIWPCDQVESEDQASGSLPSRHARVRELALTCCVTSHDLWSARRRQLTSSASLEGLLLPDIIAALLLLLLLLSHFSRVRLYATP